MGENMTTALIRYNAACMALAEAKAVDEVKDIRDKAIAMKEYARQAKNRTLEIDAAEIRLRAERRLGEMIRVQKETVGLAKGRAGPGRGKAGSPAGPAFNDTPTLVAVGIDKKLSARAQKLATLPEAEFETKVAEWRQCAEEEKDRVVANLMTTGPQRTLGTGENEWYTPARYAKAARLVMGEIDLDPASSAEANAVIRADVFFSAADDGLTRNWYGKIWLNPPYAQPYIDQFVRKAVAEYQAGRMTEGVLLTHAYTDTKWFHNALAAASAVCFTRGRIPFESKDRTEIASPTQGQAFFYFGRDPENFLSVFSEIGAVLTNATPKERGSACMEGRVTVTSELASAKKGVSSAKP